MRARVHPGRSSDVGYFAQYRQERIRATPRIQHCECESNLGGELREGDIEKEGEKGGERKERFLRRYIKLFFQRIYSSLTRRPSNQTFAERDPAADRPAVVAGEFRNYVADVTANAVMNRSALRLEGGVPSFPGKTRFETRGATSTFGQSRAGRFAVHYFIERRVTR